MPHKIDLEEIAKKNACVDLDALEEGRKLRQGLRESPKRHRTMTTARRRVRIDDDVSSDPRVVRLQRSFHSTKTS